MPFDSWCVSLDLYFLLNSILIHALIHVDLEFIAYNVQVHPVHETFQPALSIPWWCLEPRHSNHQADTYKDKRSSTRGIYLQKKSMVETGGLSRAWGQLTLISFNKVEATLQLPDGNSAGGRGLVSPEFIYLQRLILRATWELVTPVLLEMGIS